MTSNYTLLRGMLRSIPCGGLSAMRRSAKAHRESPRFHPTRWNWRPVRFNPPRHLPAAKRRCGFSATLAIISPCAATAAPTISR